MHKPGSNAGLLCNVRDTLEILRQSVRLSQAGFVPFYRVAALQLRLLLCDTTRRHGKIVDIALLPRLFPHLLLPPLRADGKPDSTANKIPLKGWLDQTILSTPARGVDLRSIIRLVCDQDGGAHFDPKPHAGLADFSDAQKWINAAGNILVDELTLQAGQTLEKMDNETQDNV